MLTIAVSVFGLMLVNWHFDVMSEIAKLSKEAAIVLNDVLKSVLPVPLEWQPSKSIVRLDIKFGADETIVVPDSRAVTAAASGTITPTAVHPDIQPTVVAPALSDIDSMGDWTEPGSDVPTLAEGTPMGNSETPLQKALDSNKAGK
jgi:hypothetical protein